jgi:hypothetical protein
MINVPTSLAGLLDVIIVAEERGRSAGNHCPLFDLGT